jgi:hypothetical protein
LGCKGLIQNSRDQKEVFRIMKNLYYYYDFGGGGGYWILGFFLGGGQGENTVQLFTMYNFPTVLGYSPRPPPPQPLQPPLQSQNSHTDNLSVSRHSNVLFKCHHNTGGLKQSFFLEIYLKMQKLGMFYVILAT